MDTDPQAGCFQDLARRIRNREAAAEEDFVRLFERRVHAFAMVNTRDPDLAAELVQEVLWAVIRALREDKVQDVGQLPAFVWGTARNLLQNRLRIRSREKLEQFPEGVDFANPVRAEEEFERRRSARQAIARLEPSEQQVLLLSLVDDMRPEQIAERLRLSYDAVRQRKSRALKKLSEMLRPRSQPDHAARLERMGPE